MRNVRTGSRHHNAKLSEAQVLEIRVSLAAGTQGKTIAAIYGMSPGTISQIKTRKLWAHLGSEPVAAATA